MRKSSDELNEEEGKRVEKIQILEKMMKINRSIF